MSRNGLNVKKLFEQRIFKKPPASDITITRNTISANTLRGYYGFEETSNTPITTVGVPYTYTGNLREYLSYGQNNDGEARVAVKGDEDIKPGDSMTIKGIDDTYEIVTVVNLYYNEVNCGKIATVKVKQ